MNGYPRTSCEKTMLNGARNQMQIHIDTPTINRPIILTHWFSPLLSRRAPHESAISQFGHYMETFQSWGGWKEDDHGYTCCTSSTSCIWRIVVNGHLQLRCYIHSWDESFRREREVNVEVMDRSPLFSRGNLATRDQDPKNLCISRRKSSIVIFNLLITLWRNRG